MHSDIHHHRVQIYYEDTDHSGAVYHANYLKYFERAREHMFGVEFLVDLQRVQGIGFVVYKAELTYKGPAHFGDTLEIQTTSEHESPYRLVVRQTAVRVSDGARLVEGIIQLACVKNGSLVPLPT
jgi:tol-pal system-associated acyl-CoA thioesterase